MSNEKRTYSAPTITDLGDVVAETRGVGGDYWEVQASAFGPPVRPPLDDPREDRGER